MVETYTYTDTYIYITIIVFQLSVDKWTCARNPFLLYLQFVCISPGYWISFERHWISGLARVSFYTNGLCVTIKDSEVTVQDTTIAKPDQAACRLCDKLDKGEIISKLRCFTTSQLNHKLSQLATSYLEKWMPPQWHQCFCIKYHVRLRVEH